MIWSSWPVNWITLGVTLILSSIFLLHDIHQATFLPTQPPYPISRFYNMSWKDRHRIQTYGRSYATEPGVKEFDPGRTWRLSDKIAMLPNVQVAVTDCAQIMRGNKQELAWALRLQEYITQPTPNLVADTSNCSHFRESRGYIEYVSPEELEFPIAFSIVMYRDPGQTERLLHAIYRPHNYYCIHVDKKTSYADLLAMEAIASCFANIAVASTLINVQWGEFSVVEAELSCMRELWPQKKWRYLINLTGQEFPLKTNQDIVKILKILQGANIIEGEIKKRPKVRTDYVYKNARGTWTKKDEPPHGIRLVKGLVKMAMSRDYVDYILHSQVSQDFQEWVKDTFIPDETFFQSLNHNPQLGVPGAFTGDPDESPVPLITRYVVWQGKGECNGKWVHWCCVQGVGDLPILKSTPEMFANKFHYEFHPLAYDCMEELHFNRTRDEILGHHSHDSSHLNMSLYKSLPYIAHHVGVSPQYKVWHRDSNDILS